MCSKHVVIYVVHFWLRNIWLYIAVYWNLVIYSQTGEYSEDIYIYI